VCFKLSFHSTHPELQKLCVAELPHPGPVGHLHHHKGDVAPVGGVHLQGEVELRELLLHSTKQCHHVSRRN